LACSKELAIAIKPLVGVETVNDESMVPLNSKE